MKRAVIYARVSTSEQSTDNQISAISRYCKRNDITIDMVFKDIASGKDKSRTQLNQMLQYIRSHKADMLIVYKLDRLGRSLQHLLQILQELQNKGIDFCSITEGYDTSTAGGKAFFQIAGAFAEFEANLISERTKEGLRQAKKEGKKLGRPKGSKDKKPRRKSGYYRRWSNNE